MPARPESVILVVFDGCTDAAFSELLGDGRFRNVLEHVIQRGVRVHTCTTTYPSTTIPAYAALTAGVLPRRAQMPGIRWFDRRAAESRVYCGSDFWRIDLDLNPKVQTIFELLPPDDAVCAGGVLTRGSGHTLRPFLPLAAAIVKHDKLGEDRAMLDAYVECISARGRPPRFSVLAFHAADSLAHKTGPDSPVYTQALEHYDTLFGELIELLRRTGSYESTVLIVVADNGMRRNDHLFSVAETLSNHLALRVRDAGHITAIPFNHYDRQTRDAYDCYVQVSGNSCVQVYCRGPSAHMRDSLKAFGPAEVDLLEALLAEPGVRFVSSREACNRYAIDSSTGTGILDVRGDTARYHVRAGADPLGYADHAGTARLMDAAHHNLDDWFAASVGTEFPDALKALSELLGSDLSGDLIVEPAPGFQPWTERGNGAHGGLHRNEITVPLALAGPGIRPGDVLCARTCDVFATVCRLLDVPIPEGIDGKPIGCLSDDLIEETAEVVPAGRGGGD